MDGNQMRAKRKALGLTQAQFGEAIGLSRDFVAQMELGKRPISLRTVKAVSHVTPLSLDKKASLRDPLERMIEEALIAAGVEYRTDEGGGTEHRLDFHIPTLDLAIEVKRFHTHRVADQIARAPNVILVQGERAARALAQMIRSGGLAAIT